MAARLAMMGPWPIRCAWRTPSSSAGTPSREGPRRRHSRSPADWRVAFDDATLLLSPAAQGQVGVFQDITARIEADQKQGLIPDFEARPVAFALNRLNAYTLLQAFGRRPRQQPDPVRVALTRVWISTLYGAEWLEKKSSDLVRK